jgi:DNA repair ATPase RecN
VLRRTTNKRRLTLDSTLLITTKETLLNTENAKISELIGVVMAITDVMPDREKMDEKELATTKKDLDHLCHLAKYYQDSTQAVVFLRTEFKETYAQFTNEINLFTTCIAYFQDNTLMGMETCKYVQRWYEKAHHALEWIDYTSAVQKG